MLIDFFKNKKDVTFEQFPDVIQKKMWKHFEKEFEHINDFKEAFRFSSNELYLGDNEVILPISVFDLRGDGNTKIYKDFMENLKFVHCIEAYAVGAIIARIENIDKPAYVVYGLDNNEFVLIEMYDNDRDNNYK